LHFLEKRRLRELRILLKAWPPRVKITFPNLYIDFCFVKILLMIDERVMGNSEKKQKILLFFQSSYYT